MKLFATTAAVFALVASPVLAQTTNNTDATQTTTSKQVHATNVPKTVHHTTHHATKKHHAMSCSCPKGHMKVHHVKKQTTTTTTQTPS